MHNIRRFLLVAALVAPFLHVNAQTLLSDFSTNANWGAPVTAVGDAGTFQIVNNVGNYYTNGTPTDTQFAYMQYTGMALNYSTSWTIRMDVNYGNPTGIFDSGSGQYLNLGLLVTPGSTPGINTTTGNPTFSGYMVESNLFGSDVDTYSRDFRTSVIVANAPSTDGTPASSVAVTGPTSTAVRLSYNASTHMLTAGYDANGATGGYSFLPLSSQSVNVNTAWGMSGTDAFSLYVFGNSGWDEAGAEASPTVGLGLATVDNLTAVPEPSTYAAMFGVAALGLAAWRRRSQRVAA